MSLVRTRCICHHNLIIARRQTLKRQLIRPRCRFQWSVVPSRNRNTSNGSSDSEGLPKISMTTPHGRGRRRLLDVQKVFETGVNHHGVRCSADTVQHDTESTNVTGLRRKPSTWPQQRGIVKCVPYPKEVAIAPPGTSPQWVHHCNGENSQPSSDAQSQRYQTSRL